MFVALLFMAVPVLALGWLSCLGDDPEILIEATPAAAPKTICPKSMNPCRVVNCDKPNPRIYT